MKLIASTLVLLLAGTFALPQDETALGAAEERIVTNNIQRAVDAFNERIVELGLDPLYIEKLTTEIGFILGRAEAKIKGLKCTGLSDNYFQDLRYTISTSRLRFNFVWPRIACESKSVGGQLILLGHKFSADKSGGVEIIELRAQGDLRFSVRPIGGISLRDCDLAVTTKIKSDLSVVVQGRDLSKPVNGALALLDKWLDDNKDEIGATLCDLVEIAL